jgi:hypothetical protein
MHCLPSWHQYAPGSADQEPILRQKLLHHQMFVYLAQLEVILLFQDCLHPVPYFVHWENTLPRWLQPRQLPVNRAQLEVTLLPWGKEWRALCVRLDIFHLLFQLHQ